MSTTIGKTAPGQGKYDEHSLKILKGLEAVRKRPAMYLGSIDTRAYHHMVWEIVDNSIDEHLGGHAKNITVTLYRDGSVSVEDDGRGIPVGIHPTEGISAATVAMTTLHAGGKFDNDSYKVSGGLHGVGASVVNALSTRFEMRISREGGLYEQEFLDGGHPVKPLERTKVSKAHGTTIRFWPDLSFFEEVEGFDSAIIRNRLRNSSYLNPGLRIVFVSEPDDTTDVFVAKEFSDILDFLSENTAGEKSTTNIETHRDITTDKGNVEVFIAIRWHDMDESIVRSYANNISTPLGGQHETGFRMSVLNAINTYGLANQLIKSEKDRVTAEDVTEGLVAAIAVRLSEPKFEAQTKERLANTEARGAVQSATYQMLQTFFEENGKQAKEIVARALLAAKGRAAAKRAKDLVTDRKTILSNTSLPGKLSDCQEKDPAKSEIFIVEGDSAGGCFTGDTKISLADGRDISLRDLVTEQQNGAAHICYAIDDVGKIVIAPVIEARLTKRSAQIVAVTLDDGAVIRCTADHRFMLRGGAYREAGALTGGMALMPFLKEAVGRNSGPVCGYRAVTSVANLDELEDVYDVEVPEHHNFALTDGVFVHNSAKMGRDSKTQAILPLRGKILNVEKSEASKALKSEQITNLIRALGCGVTKSYDETKLRYHKIVIMTDADVDGEHIFTLMTTFFHRYMPGLIQQGYVYIAMPPLYRVQKGKESHYIPNDSALEEFFTTHEREKWSIARFKGLGEMDPEQLAETTMDPATRMLGRVVYGPDGPEGSNPTFETLMGDDVVPRRAFIEQNAQFARVDI